MKKKLLLWKNDKISQGCSNVALSKFHVNKKYLNDCFICEDNIADKDEYILLRETANRMRDVFLEKISYMMNTIHGEQYSREFWKRLLYTWMDQFVFVALIRYRKFSLLKKMPPSKYIVEMYSSTRNNDIQTLASFFRAIRQEEYHRYLSFQIMKLLELDVEIEEKKWNGSVGILDERFIGKGNDSKPIENKNPYSIIKKRVKKYIKKYLESIQNDPNVIPKVMIDIPLFSENFVMALMMLSGGNIQKFESIDESKLPYFKKCSNRFTYLDKIECNNLNSEEKDIIKIVVNEIPTAFIEGWTYLKKIAMSLKPANYIIGFNGWFENVVFFIYAALKAEKGAKLIGIQHGGNYCIEKKHFEYDYLDYFFTWGEGKKNNGCTFIASPAYKMRNYELVNENMLKMNNKILYGGTALYPAWGLGLSEKEYSQYILRQIDFFSHLVLPLQKELKFRNYRIDMGWELDEILKDRLQEYNKEVYFDVETGENLLEFPISLRESRLYVCDHLSTTWLEALYMNVPLIMILSNNFYNDRIDYGERDYFKKLADVGILHFSPISAAEYVNEIYDNIADWWNDTNRQSVVNEIKNHYLTIRKNHNMWWFYELLRLSFKGLENNDN